MNGVGGWDRTKNEGIIRILFPGYQSTGNVKAASFRAAAKMKLPTIKTDIQIAE